MAWDFKRELGRKGIHLFSVFILIIYLFFTTTFDHRIALLILCSMLILSLEFEYLRVEAGAKIPILNWLWRYKRHSERAKLGGEVYFLLGAIISLAIFDLRVAATAILMTTFGDLTASLFGKRFGKHRFHKKKNVEGVAAELVVNILVGWLLLRTLVEGNVWWLFSLTPLGEPLWPIILAMAVTATIVETYASKIDDNLLIPLFSGFAGHLLLLLMSLPRLW